MKFLEHYLKESLKTLYHGSGIEFSKFDINKVGTGDKLNKYGYGLYFAENKELADYYANGKYVYEVVVKGIEDFLPWEESIPSDLYEKLLNALYEKGLDKDADEMKQDFEDYEDYWSLENTYGWLETVLKSRKNASEFLYDLGVNGVVADDIHNRGKIYVAFSDDIVKMVGLVDEDIEEETFDVSTIDIGTPGKYDKKVFDKNYVNVNKDWWKGHKNPVSSNQKEIKEDNIKDFIAKLQKELPKSWRWFQQIASLEDIIELVKKENSPIPIEKSKFKNEPDTYMDIKDVLKMTGEYDEKRKTSYDVDKGNMFGNYTFAEWYLFLKDIAINGIREPIFIIKNKISEGNHRVQALKQLGYKKVPVEITNA